MASTTSSAPRPPASIGKTDSATAGRVRNCACRRPLDFGRGPRAARCWWRQRAAMVSRRPPIAHLSRRGARSPSASCLPTRRPASWASPRATATDAGRAHPRRTDTPSIHRADPIAEQLRRAIRRWGLFHEPPVISTSAAASPASAAAAEIVRRRSFSLFCTAGASGAPQVREQTSAIRAV